MNRDLLLMAIASGLCLSAAQVRAADGPIRVLIVDGASSQYHNWQMVTAVLKKELEDSGRFTVDVATTADKGSDPSFKPEFKKYEVVVSNYNGAAWPETTQAAFNEYVKGGGGFAYIHAADNSFPEWPAYNAMIGFDPEGRTDIDLFFTNNFKVGYNDPGDWYNYTRVYPVFAAPQYLFAHLSSGGQSNAVQVDEILGSVNTTSQTLNKLGQARGIALLAAAENDLALHEYASVVLAMIRAAGLSDPASQRPVR